MQEDARKWWILAAMAMALAMIFVDKTAVAVAIPSLQKDLNTSNSLAQWVINAYLLSLAALVIFGGRVGDLFGHKRVFLSGLVLFAVASFTCALAQSAVFAITSRAIQGVGGAFMVPCIAVILLSPFKSEERGKAVGLYVGSAAVFLAMGPLLGGVLTEYLSWRAVFWINIPLALICAVLTWQFVPSQLNEPSTSKVRLDWLGASLLACAMFSLIFAFMEAANYGWDSPLIIGLLITSIISSTGFILAEQRVAEPLVDLAMFRNKSFTASISLIMIMQAAFTAVIFWAIYFQNVLGYSPATAGLLTMPIVGPVIFMAPIAGRCIDRFGPRATSTVGTVVIFICAIWVALFAKLENYWLLFPGMVLYGSGAPLVISSSIATALSSADLNKRGVASGLLNGGRQLGSSAGLALLGMIIIVLNKHLIERFITHAHGALANLSYAQINGLLSGSVKAAQAINHFSTAQQTLIYSTSKAAFTFGLSSAMFVTSGITLIGFFITWHFPKKIIR